MMLRALVVLAGVLLMDGAAWAATLNGQPPIVIAHRGASGYRPEHTLASYDLAINMGADFIEPDLVSTRDGVLVARHEPNITGTTDVSSRPEFAARRTTKMVDGKAETGWFAEDFTLAEIKTLRAVERLPYRNQSYNGQFEVPTLQEVVDLARRRGAEAGRTTGLYIETKHPSYFQAAGLPLEQRLVDVLRANGLDRRDAPVFIQSFEVANLRQLKSMTDVPLIQLLDAPGAQPYDFVLAGDKRTYGDLLAPAALAGIRTYADGIGPWKRLVVPLAAAGAGVAESGLATLPSTALVADAHGAGLLVHPYTFRSEAMLLARDYGGDALAEYRQFFALGVDGVFSDFPDQALRARVGSTPP